MGRKFLNSLRSSRINIEPIAENSYSVTIQNIDEAITSIRDKLSSLSGETERNYAKNLMRDLAVKKAILSSSHNIEMSITFSEAIESLLSSANMFTSSIIYDVEDYDISMNHKIETQNCHNELYPKQKTSNIVSSIIKYFAIKPNLNWAPVFPDFFEKTETSEMSLDCDERTIRINFSNTVYCSDGVVES